MKNIELHERAVVCAKDFKRSESDLLEAIQKVDEKRVFLGLGYSSLHGYVVTELGLSNDQAYNFTRVARKSMEVPELEIAIQEGLLNVSTARRIASVIEPENQSEWIGKASTLPQRELEREIAAQAHPRSRIAAYGKASKCRGCFSCDGGCLYREERPGEESGAKPRKSARKEESHHDLRLKAKSASPHRAPSDAARPRAMYS